MAEPLDRNEALDAFERFRRAVAAIASVPKAVITGQEEQKPSVVGKKQKPKAK